MKEKCLLLVLVLISCGIGKATTINFDYWTDGSPIPAPTEAPYLSITDEFEEWGIMFESTTKIIQHSTSSDLDTPPNCLFPDHTEDNITLDARFVCPENPSLPGTVPWVSFFQDRGAQSGGGTFIAYDIDGNEVINESFHTSGKTFHTFNDWGYVGAIHRIYIGYCKDGVDDLEYGDITCVPEPPCVATDYEFVTTWGELGSGDEQFNHPFGISINSTGYVYVADDVNHRIKKYDSIGNFIGWFGGCNDPSHAGSGHWHGPGSGHSPSSGSGDGQFTSPYDVVFDSAGYAYVVDHSNNRVQKFTSDGTFVTKWGTAGTGDGQFNRPRGVAVDASGCVYVVDGFNHRVQKFTGDGTFVTKWGSYGSGDDQFKYPVGIAVGPTGDVYVADTENSRIQKSTSNGTPLDRWYGFNHPYALDVDSSGYVYVADTENYRIVKLTESGDVVAQWGTFGSGEGEFNKPSGITVDACGVVYVSDLDNHRVQKFAPMCEPPCEFSDDFTGTTLDTSLWSVFVDALGQYHWPYVADGLLHSQGYHTRIDSIPAFAAPETGQSVMARASIRLAGDYHKFGFAPNPWERTGPITGYYFDTLDRSLTGPGEEHYVHALAWFQPASGDPCNLLDVKIHVTWYEFHEFAIERTPSEVIYSIDGQEVARVADAFAGALPVGVWNDRWSLMLTDWVEVNCEPATINVAIDIKPGSCPNPLNVKSKGVLPVAILGTADVNVIEIDPTSVAFSIGDVNVGAIRCSYDDVAGPALDTNDCNCMQEGPDGFLDLTLKFETQAIVGAIGEVNDGDVMSLPLTGALFEEFGGAPIQGADCIVFVGKHKPLNVADLNKDGVVNMVDFVMMTENWLQSSIIED